jgi:hypothetical protein
MYGTSDLSFSFFTMTFPVRSQHTLTPMNTCTQTLPIWAHSKNSALNRSGDSRSHHWRIIVDGNVTYHLTHNASKSWENPRKSREHQNLKILGKVVSTRIWTLVGSVPLNHLTIGLQANSLWSVLLLRWESIAPAISSERGKISQHFYRHPNKLCTLKLSESSVEIYPCHKSIHDDEPGSIVMLELN